MKRSALVATIVLLTLSLFAITWELRTVVVSLIVALAIASTLEAPVEWFVKHRWPRTLAVVVVFLAVIGALFGLVSAISLRIARELDPLAQDLAAAYGSIYSRLLEFAGTGAGWVTRLPVPEKLAASITTEQTAALLRGVLGVTENLGSHVGPFLLAIVLSIYLTIDRTRFERLWLSLVPPTRRPHTRRFWRSLNTDVGAYMRSEVLQTVLAGVMLAGGYWLIGIRYPFLLAFFAALAWLVPLLGGVIALVPLLMIGWLSGPVALLSGLVYTVAILIFMEFFVERRLHQHERYWGMLVVLLMLVLGDALGLLGLVVGGPRAVGLESWVNEIVDAPAAAGVDLASLEERLAGIHARVDDDTTAASPRHASLVARLDGLMVAMTEGSVID